MAGVKGRFYARAEHPEALMELISASLQAGDGQTAFRFADRLCRAAPPSARARLWRAEALRLIGHQEEALADLDLAVRADPTIPEINAAFLDWGPKSYVIDAAERLLKSGLASRQWKERASRELLSAGKSFVSDLRFLEGVQIVGWVLWSGSGSLLLEIETENGSRAQRIEANPAHWLSHLGSAADVAITRGAAIVAATWALDGKVLAVQNGPGASPRIVPAADRKETPANADAPARVNVIVPVYADFEATRDCLQSLIAQTAGVEINIVVVDDASPSMDIRDFVDRLAAHGAVTLIRNSRNLGFVGAVNAAFAIIGRGDVLLLNSDAWLPPGAVERLRRAAYSHALIGSVAPFSNNSEFTSFPAPFVENPMPSKEDMVRIDKAFAQANQDKTVMIPSGTGFCLYIKEACHKAVGSLSTLYGSGYGEDVEWGLAARERGYHHVCAADVYVGHAGTLSFRSAKRALVMRNLRIVGERYPGYSRECLAFMNTDPLALARGGAERLCPPQGVRRLLVAASQRDGSVLDARARQVRKETEAPAPLLLRRGKTRSTWEFRGDGVEGPKCLTFDLAVTSEGEAMGEYIRQLRLDRIEIAGFPELDEECLERLVAQGAPIDMICADAWPILPAAIAGDANCASASGWTPCSDCAQRADIAEPVKVRFLAHLKRLTRTLGEGSRVVAMDPLASHFAAHAWSHWPRLDTTTKAPQKRLPARAALGVLAPTRSAEVDRFLKALGRGFASLSIDAPVVVLGECLDDLAVMASGTVFVTGSVKPDEYREMMEFNGVGLLLSPYRSSHGWIFAQLGLEGGSPPLAYFDWSFGAAERAPEDLALDPRLCDFQASRAIAQWVKSGIAPASASESDA